MKDSKPNQNKQIMLTNLLTTSMVCKIFDVKNMTIWNWRTKETDPLPTVIIPGDRRHNVRFDLGQVEEWAKRNKKNMPYKAKVLKRLEEQRAALEEQVEEERLQCNVEVDD